MNRKRDSNLNSLETLLPSVSKKMGIDFRLKELMILNYWSEIAQGELGKDSKPYSIKKTHDGLVLYIGAKSAMVVQELNMVKMVLLDKINALAFQVGFKISNIVISTTYWEHCVASEKKDIPSAFDKEEYGFISQEKLESIELTNDQENSIDEIVNNIEMDSALKQRIRNVIAKDIKSSKYKSQQGFPKCANCGVFLKQSGGKYCPACKY